MTQTEFLEKWKHEIGGMILDGATAEHKGAALGFFCREIMKKVDRTLVAMHNDLTKPDEKPSSPKGIK